MADLAPPSPFFVHQLDRIRAAARLGCVIDLACGRGRHAVPTAEAGVPVIGIDRDAVRLRELFETASTRELEIAPLRADLEAPSRIPIADGSCGAVLVFRYLHRALSGSIVRALAPGGLLVYETFTTRQRELGHGPRSPEFLLQPGELPQIFAELEILEHWEGISSAPQPEAIARLAARRRH